MLFSIKFHILISIIIQCALSSSLCSINKLNNKCVCKRITGDSNLPETIADCANIELQRFPDNTELVDNINDLDLSFNMISKLDQNGFNSDSLKTVKLSYNFIESIEDNFFDNVPNLRHLFLDHNKLTNLDRIQTFQNLKNLLHLDLSYNNIIRLAFNIFSPHQNLRVLDLSYNEDLGILWSNSSNSFLGENLGVNKNITHLQLDRIGIIDFPFTFFDGYNNLKYLSLADNYFQEIPSVPYSVEYLDLSGSDISVLQAKHLNYHSLKVFKLNRLKKLVSIHHYAFYNLHALEELYLANCYNLPEFNELVFGLISKTVNLPLKKLSLASNSLNTLNETYQYLFNKMEFVDLSNNPWECDCDLIWFQEFKGFFHNEDHVRCFTPRDIRDKLVSEIVDEDVPDCYPEKYGKKAHRIILPILIVLIIVLSALIGYLVFYAPNLRSGRGLGIGPQSPYNPASQD